VAGDLAGAGFKVISLANNHALDCGISGLESTLTSLDHAGIKTLGAARDRVLARSLVRTDIKGLRIGWLGCGRTLLKQATRGPGFWELEEEELIETVSRRQEEVDLLLVSVHTGFMFLDYPHPDQKDMAERLVAAGAHIVLMHHPHVLQGVATKSDGRTICYSLGNFLFDCQEGNIKTNVVIREQNQGGVFVFDVDRQGVALAAFVPTVITDGNKVGWPKSEEGAEIIARLNRISSNLNGDFARLFAKQRAERNTGLTLRVLWFLLRRGRFIELLGFLRRARPAHLSFLLRWLTRGWPGASS
jgi:hypothetical protein